MDSVETLKIVLKRVRGLEGRLLEAENRVAVLERELKESDSRAAAYELAMEPASASPVLVL